MTSTIFYKALLFMILFSACNKVSLKPSGGYKFYPISERVVIREDSVIFDGKGDTVSQIIVENASHIVIKNVTVTSDSSIGILVYAEGEEVSDVLIDNVEAYGFNYAGILLTNDSLGSLRDITVKGSVARNNGYAGIVSDGFWPNISNSGIRITKCDAYDNEGIKGMRPHSGHGIVVSYINGGIIDSCRAWNNGYKFGHGNIGIWAYDSKFLIFEYNESFNNISVTGTDGGGMDIDGGCEGVIMRYNKTWGNTGAGFLAYEYGSPNPMINNSFLYNESTDDGLFDRYSNFSLGGEPGTSVFNTVLIGNRAKPRTGKAPVTYFNQGALKGVTFQGNSWQ